VKNQGNWLELGIGFVAYVYSEDELIEHPYISMKVTNFSNKRLATHLHCFKDDQAAIAAFFSACFLFFAGSPVNVIPANSTIPVKTGKCPRPDLYVVY